VSGFVFVDELPGRPYQAVRSPNRKVRPEAKLLEDFADALRARPMEWALWPRPLTKSSATATSQRVREGFFRQVRPGGGFECCWRVDKVFVRFNPDRVAGDSDLAFRQGFAAGRKRALGDLGGIVERAFQSARAELRDAEAEAAR